ncbi:MAG: CsgG/HfaB family protein [Elusimicrobiales bacterium]|jgi:curli biogenesis system outer membrane secretion channel CsgG
MKNSKLMLLPSALFLLASCAAPQVAVNPRADFSAVKRVAVLPFNGPKGDLAADMLTQSLIMHGADVVERQRLDSVLKEQSLSSSTAFDSATAKQLGKLLGVDAIFVGTVGESTPQTSYLVNGSNNPIVTSVTQVSGGSVYSDGSVLGMPNSQILSTTANVSLVSRMVDVQTGSIMWSASMSYEGFDITSAMREISESFASSLTPIWPGLYKIK